MIDSLIVVEAQRLMVCASLSTARYRPLLAAPEIWFSDGAAWAGYCALRDLARQHADEPGWLPNLLEVRHQLASRGQLAEMSTLLSDPAITAYIDDRDWGAAADIVQRAGLAKRMSLAHERYQSAMASGKLSAAEAHEIFSREVQEINVMSQRSWPMAEDDMLRQLEDRMLELESKGITDLRLRLGFPSLDQILGGVGGGEMCILAGRPGTGKSAMSMQISEDIAREGGEVLFISREMGRQVVAQKIVQRETGVPFLSQHSAVVAHAREKRSKLSVWYHDSESRITGCLALCRHFASLHPKLKLIVLDNLGCLADSGRPEDVARCSRQIMDLAKSLDTVPIMALHHINRQIDRDDREPSLSDLRDSGKIEDDASSVIVLRRKKGDLATECHVLKNRNGECGMTRLGWDGPRLRFVDPALDPKFMRQLEEKSTRRVEWTSPIEMEDIEI